MSLALEQTNLIQKKITRETPIPKHIAIIMDGNRRWQKNMRVFVKNMRSPATGEGRIASHKLWIRPYT